VPFSKPITFAVRANLIKRRNAVAAASFRACVFNAYDADGRFFCTKFRIIPRRIIWKTVRSWGVINTNAAERVAASSLKYLIYRVRMTRSWFPHSRRGETVRRRIKRENNFKKESSRDVHYRIRKPFVYKHVDISLVFLSLRFSVLFSKALEETTEKIENRAK